MRSLIALLLLSLSGLGLTASPASAAHVRYVYSVATEWNETGKHQSVMVETHWHIGDGATYSSGERFVPRAEGAGRPAASSAALPRTGRYGPFRVVSGDRAVLAGTTDAQSPAQFAAMLRDHPGLQTLEMRDCPGTANDHANLKLGRMIRAAGLATHVPAGGSVRSGAVELFLAGATRRVDDGAEFAVHSWMDIYGRQAKDFALSAPQNRAYLDYYREMGMTSETARAFYAMTNSVPFSEALWLKAGEMRAWLSPAAPRPAAPHNARITPAHIPASAAPQIASAAAATSAAAGAENATPRLGYLDFESASF